MSLSAVISALVVGLIAGVLARVLMPGALHIGLLGTALVGVAGSFVGGFIASLIWKKGDGKNIQPGGIVLSIIGAMIILFIWQRLH
jgi:uncharacterized membrane protein YeaQ/YmgE (transglycosylase-associated protein family)